jgi:hypothetical protein
MGKKTSTTGKKKGGQRKRGRMLIWCQNYRKRGQREINKKRKLAIHIANHPNDVLAQNVKV